MSLCYFQSITAVKPAGVWPIGPCIPTLSDLHQFDRSDWPPLMPRIEEARRTVNPPGR